MCVSSASLEPYLFYRLVECVTTFTGEAHTDAPPCDQLSESRAAARCHFYYAFDLLIIKDESGHKHLYQTSLI